MTKRTPQRRHGHKDDQDDYKVGYGRPPRHTRFQRGRSGNPAGRPKGTRNTPSLAEIGNEKVPVNNGGRRCMMTRTEIVRRKIWEKAMNGDIKAFLEVLSHIEASEKADAERRGVHFTIEYVDPKKPEPTG